MTGVHIRQGGRWALLGTCLLFLCDTVAVADCESPPVPLALASISSPAMAGGLVWPAVMIMNVESDGQHFSVSPDGALDSPPGDSGPPSDVYWSFELASPSPNGVFLTRLLACRADECDPPPAAVPIPGTYVFRSGSSDVLGAEVTATMVAIRYMAVDGETHDVRYGPFPQQ